MWGVPPKAKANLITRPAQRPYQVRFQRCREPASVQMSRHPKDYHMDYYIVHHVAYRAVHPRRIPVR